MIQCLVAILVLIGSMLSHPCVHHTITEDQVNVANQQMEFEQIQNENEHVFYAALEQQKVKDYLDSLPKPIVRKAPTTSGSDNGAFLNCVRHRESRGDYTVVNKQPVGNEHAAGAYQFLPSTWNSVARRIGRMDLVGVNPAQASPADQDEMARQTLRIDGRQPWAGPGC